MNNQGRNTCHHLGAVDQGQTLACLKNQRGQTDYLQGLCPVQALSLIKCLSHAD